MTYHFILSLSGNTVNVKGFSFRVTKDLIAEAIEVPRGEEAWFKNAVVTEIDMNRFVKSKHRDSSWSIGFPRECLTDEWNAMERQYFTCEGRYAMVHLYHMRFLAHIAGMKPLDLPFFLYKSLKKMVTEAKGPDGINPGSVFHQGLIRVLYMHAVQRRVKPIPRPRGRNREVGGPSNEEKVEQTVSPASGTKSQKKQREQVRTKTPVSTEGTQHETDSCSTKNVASNKTVRARGKSQTHEESGSSTDNEVFVWKDVKWKDLS